MMENVVNNNMYDTNKKGLNEMNYIHADEYGRETK